MVLHGYGRIFFPQYTTEGIFEKGKLKQEDPMADIPDSRYKLAGAYNKFLKKIEAANKQHYENTNVAK